MAATYAHATAPLRRLADRYVVEAALAVANGDAVPDDVAGGVRRAARGDGRRPSSAANRVDRAVHRPRRGGRCSPGARARCSTPSSSTRTSAAPLIQIAEPAVARPRRGATASTPATTIRVRLVDADPVSPHASSSTASAEP